MSVPDVRRRIRTALAGGSATVVAVVVMTGCTAEQPAPGAVAPAPTSQAGEVLSLAKVVDASPLAAGRYLVSISGAPTPSPLSPVLTVPAGYERIEGAIGVSTGDLDHYVWVWDVKSVYVDPCQDGYQVIGPTVADLAGALAAQQPRTGTPTPVPVTVGGYDGLYLELTVPADADLSTCSNQALGLWPGRWQQHPGQVDMIWIIDVDGHRLVFDASHTPTTDPAAVTELEAMVTTATFSEAAAP